MALRCLLVDDSARFLESARALLERDGVEVAVASTGVEAVRRIDELGPDVVLLDIDLGGESGFDVARKLHATRRAGTVPAAWPQIILISTHSEGDFEDLIEASPALGFVSKSTLSATVIRATLERRRDRPAATHET